MKKIVLTMVALLMMSAAMAQNATCECKDNHKGHKGFSPEKRVEMLAKKLGLTDEQKAKIEETAQAILDARAKYPDSSLADLYDPLTMPPELLKAHQANDRAVMEAYGIKRGDPEFSSESACVAMLMKMYQELTKE